MFFSTRPLYQHLFLGKFHAAEETWPCRNIVGVIYTVTFLQEPRNRLDVAIFLHSSIQPVAILSCKSLIHVMSGLSHGRLQLLSIEQSRGSAELRRFSDIHGV